MMGTLVVNGLSLYPISITPENVKIMEMFRWSSSTRIRVKGNNLHVTIEAIWVKCTLSLGYEEFDAPIKFYAPNILHSVLGSKNSWKQWYNQLNQSVPERPSALYNNQPLWYRKETVSLLFYTYFKNCQIFESFLILWDLMNLKNFRIPTKIAKYYIPKNSLHTKNSL